VHEKYLALARDAGSAGDRIAAENYLQHAEHYFRIINTDNDGDSQGRGRGQQNGSDGRSGRGREAMDGPDAAPDARGEQPDAMAAAPEAEVVPANGAGEQPDVGAGEQPDVGPGETDGAEAAEPAPKRRAGRGNGKGRGTRAKSKTSESGGDDVSAGPNGADAGDGDVPPVDE
jgi:hypothetical protein